MSLDEPLAPELAPPVADTPNPPPGWTLLGASDDLAAQSQSPTVAMLDRLYVYGGLQELDTLVTSSGDGGRTWSSVRAGGCFPVLAPGGTVFNGRLWQVGGDDLSHTIGDTSASRDGQRWTRESNVGPWGPRWAHAVIPFNGKLHLLAGATQTGLQGDVWRFEPDPGSGMPSWSCVGAFAPRYRPAAAVLGGQLLAMGGMTDDGALAETLTSPDGATWTAHRAPWKARSAAAAVTLGDTVYLIGGQGMAQAFDDVWATKDGVTWTQLPGAAPFGPVAGHGAAAVDDHIVVVGGMAGGAPNRQAWAYRPPALGWSILGRSGFPKPETKSFIGMMNGQYWCVGRVDHRVIRSEDGVMWTDAGADIPRPFEVGTVHDGALWVCGGDPEHTGATNEVWTSSDGVHWSQAPTPQWTPRFGHCMASYRGRLWVIGGFANRTASGEVWSWSPKAGGPWRQEASLPARLDATAVVFEDKLWVLGGANMRGGAPEPCWTDGGSWTSQPTPWGGRSSPGVAVVGTTLYVVGGLAGGEWRRDAWGTGDGVNWVQLEGPPWTDQLQFSTTFALNDGTVAVAGGLWPSGENMDVYRWLPPQLPPP